MLLNNRPLLITIVLLVILLVLLIITAGTNNIAGVQSIVGGLLEPVQGAFYSATDSVVGFFATLFSQNDMESQNAALKAQLNELTAQLTEYNEIKAENERLRALIGFKEQNPKFVTIPARVTGRAPGQWSAVFTINAGVNSGVKKDMAVVAAEGLVGRVVDTGATWARVMAIVDPDSGVSGLIERTRENGVVKGVPESAGTPVMTMEFLPFEADLMPGDTVITSGTDEIFPKGIAIGSVTEVSQGKDSSNTNATIIPAVDFYRLEEVMVITDVEEEA